jgi:hypothetical protein
MKQSELYDTILQTEPEELVHSAPQYGENAVEDEIDGEIMEIIDAFEDYSDSVDRSNTTRFLDDDQKYNTAQDLLDFDYSQRAVTHFLEDGYGNGIQHASSKYDYGIFHSALINNLDHKRVIIPAIPNSNGVGYRNQKDLIVRGHTGLNFCQSMESGEVRVKGNTATGLGDEMKGGEIKVEGDVRGFDAEDDELGNTGFKMEGGKIEIMGDAGVVGQNSDSGEILLHGEGELFDNTSARVYKISSTGKTQIAP